jgi:hypothetical protein
MERIGYGEYIANTVKNMPYEAAIQTEDIAERLVETFALPYDHAKTLTNVKMKRMADKGEIERLQKGVYCQVKQTIFGKVAPSIDQVMKKMLTEQYGEKIGYESGAFLLNRIGLTTLVPRDMEITTNRYGAKLPEGCRIKMKKSVTAVTDNNWKYLQFIDLISELPQAHIDVEKPELLLARYAKTQELNVLTLVFTARTHYPVKMLLPLIDLLMEVNDELTSG